jgi:hypothetical protein
MSYFTQEFDLEQQNCSKNFLTDYQMPSNICFVKKPIEQQIVSNPPEEPTNTFIEPTYTAMTEDEYKIYKEKHLKARRERDQAFELIMEAMDNI